MDRVKTFLLCLEKWSSSIPDGVTELRELIFHLNYSLGGIEMNSDIAEFEKRINFLNSEVKIKKKFIITGLLEEVDYLLNRKINNMGEYIVNNQHLQQSYLNDYGVVPEFAKNLSKEDLYKNILKYEKQIDEWNKLVSLYFNKTNEREWQYDNIKD